MPRNGSGLYTLPQPPFITGTTISSSAVNSDFSDIATALTGSVSSDGQTAMTGGLHGFAGTAVSPTYFADGDIQTGLYPVSTGVWGFSSQGTAAFQLTANGIATTAGVPFAIPIGAVSDFAGSTAPTGWYLCYGQAVSRTTYSALFAVIGTAYGIGDGVTTFNLPDLRGYLTAGRDNMGGSAANRITNAGSGITGTTLGANGGAQNVTLSRANLPNVDTIADGAGNIPTVSPVGTLVVGTGASTATAGVPQVPTGSHTLVTADFSVGGHIYLNGNVTQTAVQDMPPTTILNKIIYAGA